MSLTNFVPPGNLTSAVSFLRGYRGMGEPMEGTRKRTRRRGWILIVLLLLLAAGAGGYFLGRGKTPVLGASAPTGTGTATPSSPSSSPSTSPSPAGGLADGRYFVYAKKVTGGSSLTFVVAQFLTGKAAADAATAHGDESPPPNDYYIVRDNKKRSTYPVSTAVVVRYIPTANCCNLKLGNFSAWSEAVNGTAMTDYLGKNAPWWITISGGSIVKIQQQFLP